MKKRVILASSSPRRKELLARLIEDFEIAAPNCEENDADSPQDTALFNSIKKAYCVRKQSADGIIIASDTVVALGGKIYGKPSSRQQAIDMLLELQGKWHKVFSGICVLGKREISYYVESQVKLKEMDTVCIAAYVDNFHPFDKAGGYGIQDDEIVELFEGDYHNIMGLPLTRLQEILRENGVNVKQ